VKQRDGAASPVPSRGSTSRTGNERENKMKDKEDTVITATTVNSEGEERELNIPATVSAEATKIMAQREDFRNREIESIADAHGPDMGTAVDILSRLLEMHRKTMMLVHKTDLPMPLEKMLFDEIQQIEALLCRQVIDLAMPTGKKLRDLGEINPDNVEGIPHARVFKNITRIVDTDIDAKRRAADSLRSFVDKAMESVRAGKDDTPHSLH
jgi:hypothetical protein